MHLRLNLGLALIPAVLLAVPPARAQKPPLCTEGRFVVDGAPLLGPGGEILVLTNRTVAIGNLCAGRAKLKRTRAGTRLRAKFKKGACTGVLSKVKLAALIGDSCRVVSGTLKVGKTPPVQFAAAPSICGDGVVDAVTDEQCDGQSGCSSGQVCSGTCVCVTTTTTTVPRFLTRPSKSGTIAITDNNELVAMVNPDDDSISVFRTADNTRLSKVATGDEPWALVLAADNTTAFVANRAAATVVRVTGINTANPSVSDPGAVGSEPTGLALSPSGAKLFVAEFAEGRVSVLDTGTLAVTGTIDSPQNPRAIAVTNDGDADDDDEHLIVPEFFGEPNVAGETKDTGRTGRGRIYRVSDLTPESPITFAPLDSGFPQGGVPANPTVMTSPNQLWAVALRGGRIYLPSVAASPEGPPRFDNNVFAVVWVGDLGTRMEVRTGAGTTNLAREVVDNFSTRPRFVLGDIVDMDFIPGTSVSYVVSRGADAVQRVTWNDVTGVELGSTTNQQIDVIGNSTLGRCQAPTGIALRGDANRAYLNCWVSRVLGVIDLASQSLMTTVPASDLPTDPGEMSVQRGKRFYNTGRGRWSNAGGAGAGGVGPGGNEAIGGEGWSSCGSCHPDGLTDNITWVFAAGPRQTTSQDGSFSHGTLGKQRIFNHTGIFDEHHDFEGNTRGVSGGLGAITTAASIDACNSLTTEMPVATPSPLAFGLAKPAREIQEDMATAVCQHKDWDDIDNFVKAIRPPGRIRSASAASVASGRALFDTGECDKCHGGAGWTLSERFFTPLESTNTTLAGTPFVAPVNWPATWSYGPRNQISNQPTVPMDLTGPAEGSVIMPPQVACVLRNVGTFGIPGDSPATDLLEVKATGTRAQGRAGYNIPSLYGLALGAPYLHHGQAKTLDELFTDNRWDFHTNAANANFDLTLDANPQNVNDLKNFLLSIDAAQTEFMIDPLFDGCP